MTHPYPPEAEQLSCVSAAFAGLDQVLAHPGNAPVHALDKLARRTHLAGGRKCHVVGRDVPHRTTFSSAEPEFGGQLEDVALITAQRALDLVHIRSPRHQISVWEEPQ